MKLEYGFLCEVGGHSRKRQMSLDTNAIDGKPVRTWDHARYLLEYQMRMHITCNKGSPVYSCLHGMRLEDFLQNNYKWNRGRELRGNDRLAGDTQVVLKRMPIPQPLQRYVPDRFCAELVQYTGTQETVLQEEDQDEDALIASVMADTAAMFKVPDSQKHTHKRNRHASEFDIGEHGAIPPPNYRCNGCGVTGEHFRKQCPRDLKGEKKALDKCRVPHGIPKALLETVKDGQSQLRTEDGLFVQRTDTSQGKNLRKFFPGLYLKESVDKPNNPRNKPNNKPNKKPSKTWDFESFLDAVDQAEKKEERAFYKQHPEMRRKKHSLCQYYLRGLCQKSAWECQFLHKVDESLMPICQFFVKNECSAGDTCIFKHELPRPKRLPTCQNYKRGFCPSGTACPNNHIKYPYPRSAKAVGIEQWEYQVMTQVLNNQHRPHKRQRYEWNVY